MGGDNGLMRSLTWFTRPTVPVMYSNGHYGNQDGSDISFSKFKNPIEMMSQVHNKQTGWRFDGQVFGEVNILKGLKFRSSLAYKLYIYDASWYNKRSRKYNAEGALIYKSDDNSLTANHKVDYGYLNENILTYDQRFGLHHVNALPDTPFRRTMMAPSMAVNKALPLTTCTSLMPAHAIHRHGVMQRNIRCSHSSDAWATTMTTVI